jgi:hypothetical protein
MHGQNDVDLFREFTERGFRVSAFVVSVGDGACFAIQIRSAKTGDLLCEEVCPPMKHSPDPFIHTDDLLALEEKTEEILGRRDLRPTGRTLTGPRFHGGDKPHCCGACRRRGGRNGDYSKPLA